MEPVIILLVIIVVLAVVGVLIYNGLVARRNRVDEAVGQVEVQLKRRHDLVPNLVAAVKGYMDFEQDVLTKVTEARAAAVAAGAKGPTEQAAAEKTNDYVTVILPEFVPARWWQHLLHNQTSLLIKGALLFRPNIVVTSVPFHLSK